MDTKTLKAAMVAYMKKHGLPAEQMVMDADVWGEAAKTNAWRISTYAGWKPSTARTRAARRLGGQAARDDAEWPVLAPSGFRRKQGGVSWLVALCQIPE